jgi:hypothetical protein
MIFHRDASGAGETYRVIAVFKKRTVAITLHFLAERAIDFVGENPFVPPQPSIRVLEKHKFVLAHSSTSLSFVGT